MSLQTVDKVGRVLSLFSLEHSEWGVSEVAQALGLPKSGAHALMSSLANQGLLYRTRRGRYRLGWRTLSLSEILMQTADFRSPARQAMEYLVSRFGEVVHLAALEGTEVVFLDKVVGPRSARIAETGRGLKLPAHSTALGKVLLAYRSWERILRDYYDGLLKTLPNTVTILDDLQSRLEVVRERGYAYDIEETSLNLCCVAAPIRDRSGEVVAAMSISVPADRFEQGKKRYQTALVETARHVSEDVGHVVAR